MEDERPAGGDAAAPCPPSFWIDGGPGDGLLRRLHLAPVRGRAAAEIVVLVALTWVPLVILAAVDGTLADGPAIPFLVDVAVHVRFLVAAPLLVLADLPVGAQLARCTAQFLAAGLVRPGERPQYDDCVADARRARDGRFSAFVVFVAAYAATVGLLVGGELRGVSTWYAPEKSSGLTLAGRWYVFVALPIFNFILFRWVHRLLVWGRFLRKVARLDLRLSAAHPDRAGGLGFLGPACTPLALLLLAVNAVVASAITTRIVFEGADLEQFRAVYLALLMLGLAVVTGPTLVFVPALIRVKTRSQYEYGALAGRCAQSCEQRWLGDRVAVDASILESSVVQSLADLAAIHEIVRTTRVFPLGRRELVILVVAGLLPAIPVLATTIPVREIFRNAAMLLP
jgi:hypothetical protein